MTNQNIWVIFELTNHTPKRVSLELMQKAAGLAGEAGQKAVAVIVDSDPADAAAAAFANGADEVITNASDGCFEDICYITEKLADRYHPLAILIGSTNFGHDLSAALSARCGMGLAADCTDIILSLQESGSVINWIRPSYDGKLNTNISISDFPQIGTFRPGTLKASEDFPAKTPGTITDAAIEVPASVRLTRFLGFIPDDELMKTNIEDADILISGGRGMGSKEAFDQLFELARLVDGNVSASRAAVDEGWTDRDRQVGITGKTVTPKLYIAFGISGAEPHVAGMKESDVIVAVNTDPQAPIFDLAHYGVVADLHKVIPVMIDKLSRR
jgi:electron transfer flavoprotein alpha subunit